MDATRFRRFAIFCLFLGLVLLAGWGSAPQAASAQPAAPAGLNAGAWGSIREQMRIAGYFLTLHEASPDRPWASKTGSAVAAGAYYQAPNRAQGWQLAFDAGGVHLAPSAGSNVGWSWGWTLTGYGYRDSLRSLRTAPALSVSQNRLTYSWPGGLQELYVNRETGLAHSFRLLERPAAGPGRLTLELALRGDLQTELQAGGQAVVFRTADGERVLRYAALHAYDATGRELPARLALADGVLLLEIDDRGAVYPLLIDSLLTTQVAKLTASDAAADDRFGYSVAVSGDTVVVGAYQDDDGGASSGSAYIFTRNQGGADGWGQVAKLTAGDAAAGDLFGHAVAISGDTLVVGAYQDDDGGGNSGAAYVFTRNAGGGDNWGQAAKLTAGDAAASDWFGYSVGVSGDTVVAGAYKDDDAGASSGSAYIFTRNTGGTDSWGQVAKLTAGDAAAGDFFGYSVGVSGDTVVAGAYQDDDAGTSSGSAYIFTRNTGGADSWGQVSKLTAGDAAAGDYFGHSVAVSGDAVVIGAPLKDDPDFDSGAAYVFARNTGGADSWGQVQKLTAADNAEYDELGNSVAIAGDTIVVGARYHVGAGTDPGAAYVFARNQGGADNWGQIDELIPDDGALNDYFGSSVAVSGDTVVVGSPFDSDSGQWSGSAYVFSLPRDPWGQTAKPVAADGALGDLFGRSLAVSGDTLVVGAYSADNVGLDSGSVYIFTRNTGGADSWGQVVKLTASDAATLDNFGWSVTVSGDTVVVGTPHDDDAGSSSGSVYVFTRNTGGADSWGQVAKLTAGDAAAGDLFGSSLGVSGDTLVVGAPYDDDTAANSGSVYVFTRNTGGADSWGQVQKLTAGNAAAGDTLGYAVAVSGDTIVAGARDADPAGDLSGTAYVFSRNTGGADSWGQVAILAPSDAGADQEFGTSVGISGDTVVVGAPYVAGVGPNSGAAYVFSRNTGGADSWGQVAKLTAGDAAAYDAFGQAVAISGDTLVVGAPDDDDAGGSSGAAYVFARNTGGADSWGQVAKLTAGDAAALDRFGYAVAISGSTIAAGAPWNDDGAADSGSAYIFTSKPASDPGYLIYMPLVVNE